MVRWWSRRWKALPDAPWDSEVWVTTRKGPPFPRAGARGKRWSALHPNDLQPLDLLGGALESTNQFNHSKHIQTPGMWSLQVQNSILPVFFINVIHLMCRLMGSFLKITLRRESISFPLCIFNKCCIWSRQMKYFLGDCNVLRKLYHKDTTSVYCLVSLNVGSRRHYESRA